MTLPAAIWSNFAARRFVGNHYPDIVVAVRCEIRRNFDDLPFPRKLPTTQRPVKYKWLEQRLSDAGLLHDSYRVAAQALTIAEADFFVERAWCDRAFMDDRDGVAYLDAGGQVAWQIGGDDWLRWCGSGRGIVFNELFQAGVAACGRIPDFVFACDERFGGLTAVLDESGGGRFVTVLHLPALLVSDRFDELTAELFGEQLELTARYRPGRPPPGGWMELRHRRSAASDAVSLVHILEAVALKLARAERAARRDILRTSRIALQDMVARGFGLLKHARIVRYDEWLELHSTLRLASELGWLRGIPAVLLDMLPDRLSEAALRVYAHNADPDWESGLLRAQLLREWLANAQLRLGDSAGERE